MRNELMVLMYHGIASGPAGMAALNAAERMYAVEAAEFEEHLRLIAASGWLPAETADLFTAKSGRRLLITFDDSAESHYTQAFPALARHKMAAVFFIMVGEVGAPGRVTWEHLCRMRDAGMRIESHGYTHRFMPSLDAKELSGELMRSREEIRARLGREAAMLSFPGGRWDRRVVDAAHESGYTALFGSEVGVNREERGCVLRRIPVTARITVEKLAAILRNPTLSLLPAGMRYSAARLARRFIGERLYGRLRAGALG